jgi:hypothetical protein
LVVIAWKTFLRSGSWSSEVELKSLLKVAFNNRHRGGSTIFSKSPWNCCSTFFLDLSDHGDIENTNQHRFQQDVPVTLLFGAASGHEAPCPRLSGSRLALVAGAPSRIGGTEDVSIPRRRASKEGDVPDELRCDCGRLVARRLPSGIELRCPRCKDPILLRIEDGLIVVIQPGERKGRSS